MLAEVAARLGRYDDAETLLARCLELAPGFTAARHNYAIVLHRQGKPAEALAQIEPAARARSRAIPATATCKAAVLGQHRRIRARRSRSTSGCSRSIRSQAKVWMSYGHALKTAGRRPRASRPTAAAIALEPGLGEA